MTAGLAFGALVTLPQLPITKGVARVRKAKFLLRRAGIIMAPQWEAPTPPLKNCFFMQVPKVPFFSLFCLLIFYA